MRGDIVSAAAPGFNATAGMPGACVGYVRVSGMGQITGDGFPRQCEAIDKYASAHALALVAEGARVTLIARDKEKLLAVSNELAAPA